MKLEDIGFYTLSDSRAKTASKTSPLIRCELLLTDRCNFSCPYCRKLQPEIRGDISYEQAKYVLDLWMKDNLQNVRFTGGEPTIYPHLLELVSYTKANRIAISTNGSAPIELYRKLTDHGVNDFSISLDACCASDGDMMTGNIKGAFNKTIETIRALSKLTYTTVGTVITDKNYDKTVDIIKFVDTLGVHDIRIIPSAQYNKLLSLITALPDKLLDKYPILKYRVNNIKKNRNVRGVPNSNHQYFYRNLNCWLAMDDMVVAKNYHYPCIIYLREGGKPIGKVGPNMREERFRWSCKHKFYLDPICKKNCLDVCVDHNKRVQYYQESYTVNLEPGTYKQYEQYVSDIREFYEE